MERTYLRELKSLREKDHYEIESRRACPELVERGRLNFRPVQIRFHKRLGSATTLYGTVALSFVIPSEAEFPTSRRSAETTYVVLPKENHMPLTEAATLDRKSGEAGGTAVRLNPKQKPYE
jgi:hypothetical protein